MDLELDITKPNNNHRANLLNVNKVGRMKKTKLYWPSYWITQTLALSPTKHMAIDKNNKIDKARKVASFIKDSMGKLKKYT